MKQISGCSEVADIFFATEKLNIWNPEYMMLK